MKSDFSQRGGKPLDHEALHKLEAIKFSFF